jgi:structural maintenance of chromosome 3 (chondroitin sulfate proteoglycan 6)
MRLDQLNSLAFEDSAGSESSGGLKAVQKELKKAQNVLRSVEESLLETEQTLEQLTTRMEEATQEKATLDQNQHELSHRIEKQQKRMEKTLQRKALLTTQAAECAKNIRDLGVLPEEAFDKYENMESKTVSTGDRTLRS